MSVDLVAIGGAGSRIASAAETASGKIAMCSVQGVLAPSIKFQVELPIATWTQRYLQLGCGGLCGRLSINIGAADGCAPVDAGGFALASTDMGHEGMGGAFGRDPQLRADFAYRTAASAKALIRAYYGRPEAFAYFDGCSDGGREALVEAQRFPRDFIGIIAGAEAMNFQVQNSLYHGWQSVSNTGADGKAILVAPRLAILHKAALAQCANDDGVIVDALNCHIDPAKAQCAPAQPDGGADCLGAAEVEAARRLYDGPRDAASGLRLTIGGPLPGSELNWAGVFVPAAADQPIFSTTIALDALRNLIFETNPAPDFTLKDLRFDRATFDRLRPRHPLFDATNPDLSSFARAGGKLIIWHGLGDPHISPLNSIAYHQAVRRQMGERAAQSFERLYLLPGVAHCGGGDGPSSIDLVTPMLAWVERGQAPDAITARLPQPKADAGAFGAPTNDAAPPPPVVANAKPTRPRVIFPFPATALYDGRGDPDKPASYARVGPKAPIDLSAWAGADFYQPYAAPK
jgi:feruloyl esterase